MRLCVRLRAHAPHQDVLALGEAHGDLGALTADVHEGGVDVGDALCEEEDGVLVLLLADPVGKEEEGELRG